MFRCFMCGALYPLDTVKTYRGVQLCKGCHYFYQSNPRAKANMDGRIDKANEEKANAIQEATVENVDK